MLANGEIFRLVKPCSILYRLKHQGTAYELGFVAQIHQRPDPYQREYQYGCASLPVHSIAHSKWYS